MKLKAIETEEEYEAALQEMDSLMFAEESSPEGEQLFKLIELIEEYERNQPFLITIEI